MGKIQIHGERRLNNEKDSDSRHGGSDGDGMGCRSDGGKGQTQQWIKPTAKSPGRVVVGLPEPVFWQGFVSRDFTRLTVNGISSVELEPKSIETFSRDGIAGVDALYNFDGIRMTLRFYMTEQSPMLFMEWRKDPASEGTVERAELAFSIPPTACPMAASAMNAISGKYRLLHEPFHPRKIRHG